MNKITSLPLIQSLTGSQSLKNVAQVVLGSIFFAVAAQIAIYFPFNPVPLSLQTLAAYLLGISLGSKKGFLAVATYLAQATVGLPVLAGGAVNPLWIVGPTGGYLLGFAFAAFVTGWLLERRQTPTLLWGVFSVLCGAATLYSLGITWLSFFVGWSNVISLGIFAFMGLEPIKIVIATVLIKCKTQNVKFRF